MPNKKRLHTKWDPKAKRWKVLFSTRHDRNRVAADILDTSTPLPTVMKLKDVDAIRYLLEKKPSYVMLGQREDHNWQAIINNQGHQLVDFDHFLEHFFSTLSNFTLFLLFSQSTEFIYNEWQLIHGDLSIKQERDKSAITLVAAFIIALGMSYLQYRLLHVRHHDIAHGGRTFKFTDDLLQRLDDIKEEVTIKNRVLGKLQKFFICSKKDFKLDNEYNSLEIEEKHTDKKDEEKKKEKLDTKNEDIEEGEDKPAPSSQDKTKIIKKAISITFKDQIIAGFDKTDDLELWKSIDKTLEELTYTQIMAATLSHLKEKFFYKYKKVSGVLLERINKAENYTIIDLLSDAKQLSNDPRKYDDAKLPVDFIFEQLAKSLENRDRLLAETILVELYNQAAIDNNQKISIPQLHDIVTEIITEKSQHNHITVDDMCQRILKLKPQQKMALYNIIEEMFSKYEKDVIQAIKMIMKILFNQQDFTNVISTAKIFTSQLTSEQAHNLLFFSKPAQSYLEKQAAKARIIGMLPDGRNIQYVDIRKAEGDGNCGFRAILGGKALQADQEVFTRKGVISLLKSGLKDKIALYLIAKDLEAILREYIAGILALDKFKMLPKAIQEKFEYFKMEPARISNKYKSAAISPQKKKKRRGKRKTQPQSVTQEKKMSETDIINMNRELEQINKEASTYCQDPKVIASYLDTYLSIDNNWPHIQGSLAAFGYLCNIKIHCFQRMQPDARHTNIWLNYIETEQPADHAYEREAFLLQSDVRDHFDELVCKLVSSKELSTEKAKEIDSKQEDVLPRKGLSANKVKAIKAKIPENFTVDQAIDNGDCFFDAVAQAWNISHYDQKQYDVKSLRMICHEFYLKNIELVDDINGSEHDVGYRGYQYYYIQYNQDELDKKDDLKQLTSIALWGRPEIEGMMICHKLNIKLHIIGFLDTGEMVEFIIDKEGQKTSENVKDLYIDKNILHLGQAGRHFVPILPLIFEHKKQPTFETQQLLENISSEAIKFKKP